MNQHLRKLGEQAARDINLGYHSDAYTSALTKLIILDLKLEFTKLRWAGEDQAWDNAIQAVVSEISNRYGIT